MQPHSQPPNYPPPQHWGPQQPQPWGPPQPPPRKRTSPAVIALAVIGGVLALCLVIGGAMALLGSGQEQDTADPPAATSAAPAASSAAAVAGIPPEPDQKTWDAYIADLNAINKLIVGGGTRKAEEKAIDRGRDQCSSIASGFDDQKLVDLVIQRFTSPARPDGFDRSTATRILLAVRKHICPTY